ncbi:MAG: DNA-binding response regulator [Sulfurimonas sp.]|nr:MAG: DNA-binding response regulator [Sulfurimonas sp.]
MTIETKYPYSILFVEDEKAIRDNYVSYLKMFFKEVYEAEDGEVAYNIYKTYKPQILLIDINIPKISGIDLLKKIRENDHSTKAIILTAFANTNYLLEAASLKLTKYLIKPINRKELNDALKLSISELLRFNTLSTKIINLKNSFIWNNDLEELNCNNKLIRLTNKEKKVFVLFVNNINKILSTNEIIYEVWNNENEGNSTGLKTIIKNLRKKLPRNSIENIFGIGYKLNI